MTSSKKEKGEQVQKEISSGLAALNLNINMYDEAEPIRNTTFSEEVFGLCANCTYFFAVKTRWNKYRCICGFLNDAILVNPADPIHHCTSYSKRGQMTVGEMQRIATLIDIDKKEKIGLL